MKSIKSKFIRGLSLLLALVVLLNIPISALASAVSEAAYVPEDSVIEAEMLDKGYDSVRAEMIAHDTFQALKYLGYDYDKYLEDNGLLFTKGYYGSKLLTNAPDSLTEIAWTKYGNGMQTTSSKSPYSNADSYTGKYPNVGARRERYGSGDVTLLADPGGVYFRRITEINRKTTGCIQADGKEIL